MELLTESAGVQFLLRWVHFLAGITWIGLLYYFNFVQAPFFAETDAGTKSAATQKLVPRALWWFRWAAMVTFLSGAGILLIRGAAGGGVWSTSWGIAILTGAAFGTMMFLNVWLVIWPKQRVVIGSAVTVAGGGQADPGAAAAARRAFLASRTNVVFSFPMLFFMAAASHLDIGGGGGVGSYALLIALILGLLEVNALTGATGPTKKPLETVRSVITSGVVATIVIYAASRLTLA